MQHKGRNKIDKLIRRIQGKNVKPRKPVDKATALGEARAASLTGAIDEFLTPDATPVYKKITGFHPSKITMNCRRYWYLMFEGAEQKRAIGPRIQRIFDNGHDVHARYRDYFESMGILIDDEVKVKVYDPVPISGYADGILEWGGRKLYELKSISPTRFEFRKVYNKPDDATQRQINLYLGLLGIQEGFVIYEEKGSQALLIFHIPFNEVAYDKEMKRLKGIYKNVENNTLPKRPYKRDSVQCTQCDLLDYCWDKVPD